MEESESKSYLNRLILIAKLAGDNVHPMQSVYLGSDRRFNRYWLFLGPCNANDPAGHRCVYFESSEDGHWEVISHKEALRALLDDRGRREARLIEFNEFLKLENEVGNMTRQEAVSMLLLVDVETELQRGSFSTLSISCKFLALLQSVESQILILDMWKDSLNSLTWAEILRQILVAAGFGSVKRAGGQSEELSKERRLMKKYGLRLGTLKGELFRMLNEQGGKNGLKISELANAAVEVAALNLATASEEEGERSICSTLARERIEELSKSSDSHPVDSSSIVGAAFAKLAGDNVHPMQSVYLGSDRRFNRYWLFLGPCNANDPGHRCVYFESSEDGHWEVISHKEALRALLSVLDDRGRREARLIESLEKRESFLCQAMHVKKN
ncbi:hypothetical protein F2Q69_00016436 [Brassica cretica]|uniref:WHIM2 domain-containing protein n=1 Tax=Brassica cretica TaxID=69181 RepID=A0A8S9R2U9_BRACR|nr:hypothetical protein F2Q69_00016436 [Brassica cretica]